MRRLDRRSLLTTGAAAGLLAATGLPLRAAPKRGGVLRLALSGAHPSDTWDSRTHIDTFMKVAAHGAVFDTLTQVAANGELVGELAESWQATADAKTWTFDLRKGVEFHNGKPFEALDVLQSLHLHINAASPARSIVAAITETEILNSHQIRFHLAAPNADFPFLLSDYHLCIYPADHIAEAMEHGIGTGLYKVIRFEAGKRAMLGRVAGHYKDGKEGWFDAVELLAIHDPIKRSRALATGQVDAIDQIDLGQEAALRQNPKLALTQVAGNRHVGLPMRVDQAPFHDINLRRALKHAVDRPQLLQSALRGHGEIGHDHPIGPANQFYDPSFKGLSYDADKARHYLRKAGAGGLTLTLPVAQDMPLAQAEAAEALRQSAAKAGVTIALQTVPAQGYWKDTWQNAAWRGSQWSGRVTEDAIFSASAMNGAAWNETQWDNPHFQHLLLSARAELSTQKRRSMYQEMQSLMANEGGALIPLFAHYVDGHTTRLQHGEALGNLHALDSGRMIERWWFA